MPITFPLPRTITLPTHLLIIILKLIEGKLTFNTLERMFLTKLFKIVIWWHGLVCFYPVDMNNETETEFQFEILNRV